MRRVTVSENVGRGNIKHTVSGGFGFKRKSFVLSRRQNNFGTNAQSVVMKIQTEPRPRRRNARQIDIQIGQFRPHHIEADDSR